MDSPLIYSTTNNWIHEPRMCSSIATGIGRNSDQARLMVAGKFFCLCPKKLRLKDFITWLGMPEGDSTHEAAQRDRGCSATSWESHHGTLTLPGPHFPAFCPQESKTEAMQIYITWMLYVATLIYPWAGQGAGPQMNSAIRNSVGGYEQSSLKISWTSMVMPVCQCAQSKNFPSVCNTLYAVGKHKE